jgi:hypothetical protein
MRAMPHPPRGFYYLRAPVRQLSVVWAINKMEMETISKGSGVPIKNRRNAIPA